MFNTTKIYSMCYITYVFNKRAFDILFQVFNILLNTKVL